MIIWLFYYPWCIVYLELLLTDTSEAVLLCLLGRLDSDIDLFLEARLYKYKYNISPNKALIFSWGKLPTNFFENP